MADEVRGIYAVQNFPESNSLQEQWAELLRRLCCGSICDVRGAMEYTPDYIERLSGGDKIKEDWWAKLMKFIGSLRRRVNSSVAAA